MLVRCEPVPARTVFMVGRFPRDHRLFRSRLDARGPMSLQPPPPPPNYCERCERPARANRSPVVEEFSPLAIHVEYIFKLVLFTVPRGAVEVDGNLPAEPENLHDERAGCRVSPRRGVQSKSGNF